MADHSMLSQLVQLGLETTAGTIASANRKVSNLQIELAPEGDFTEFRGAGHKYIDTVMPGDEWASGSSSGPMGFGEIVYPCASIIKKPTVTTVGTTGKRWLFDTNPYAPDVIATYTVEKGDGTSNFRWTYVYFNELTLKANRKESSFSGTVMGQTMSAGITMYTPSTAVENVIIVPQRYNVFYGPTFASVGVPAIDPLNPLTTERVQITRAFDWEFRLGNRFSSFFPMNSALTSFAGIVEQAVDATLALRLGMDTTGSDFVAPITLAKMRAGSTLYLALENIGPVIDIGTPDTTYKFRQSVAAVVNQPLSWEDQNGLVLNGWQMRVVTDATAAKPFEIEVVNKTAAL